MKIIIFGGGISGLTTAHILVQKGFQVELYESEPIIGGMARSRREPFTEIPTEHSWRGYAPFYRNFYHIAQQIPTQGGKTVVDNLADHVKFFMLNNNEQQSKLDIKSALIIAYFIGKTMLSDKRSQKDYQKAITPMLKKHISKASYDFLIKFLMGPGWGMDKDTTSLKHYAKFTELSLFHSQGPDGKQQKLWKVMKGPTQEMWFQPWQKFLEEKGVIFHLNCSLKYINIRKNTITNCILSDGTQIIGDNYIFAINPFNLENILSQSPTIPKSLTQKHSNSNNKSDYEMIAFFLAFTEKVEFSYPQPAFIMVDGPLTITFYPQDYFWSDTISLGHTPCGKSIKSLWSGTCITTRDIVQLYPKKGIELSLEELKQEILHEIFSSPDIKEKTNIDSLYDIIIWYEWGTEVPSSQLTPHYKKFSNNIYNQKYRLEQTTQFPNMYISGAHTQTTIDVWSMEGAIESGIKVSNNILEKYKLPQEPIHIHHKTPGIISQIDNILYSMKLPHIIDLLIILFIIFIILFILFIIFRKKH